MGTTSGKIFAGNSAIQAIAYWVPETVQKSAEIESQITAFNGSEIKLEDRSGLKEKRISGPGIRVIDAAMKAVSRIENTISGEPADLSDVDCIIYCSVRREYEEPATAVLIQKALGISSCFAFDVSDACLGFTDAWMIADSYIATGKAQKVLVVTAEMISILSDYAVNAINQGEDVNPHFASLTLGDCSAAAVIVPKGEGRGLNLVAGIRKTFSQFSDACTLPGFDYCMRSDSRALMQSALMSYPAMAQEIMNHLGWTAEDVSKVIPHQPSTKILNHGIKLIGMREDKLVTLFTEYGNCASASVPMGLAVALQGAKSGDKLLSIGFGSGLGVGIFALET